MATQVTASAAARTVGALAAILVTVSGLVGCTPRPDGPAAAAEQFFAVLAGGDTTAAAALSDRPDDAKAALDAAWAGLQADQLDAQLTGASFTGDTGRVDYRYTWHLPRNRTWTYDGQLAMVRDEGGWQVRWTATDLHPSLGDNQTFALRSDPPRRASVNELSGTDVLVPGNLYRYSLDAAAAGGVLMPTVHAVVEALRPFDDTLDAQRLAEQASSSAQPVTLLTLRPADHQRVAPAIASLPGVVVSPQADLLATDDGFAPDIISQVRSSVIGDLDGQAGWRVVTVNHNGADVDVLHETPAAPAPSVTISLDRLVQGAAQNAVDMTAKKAMVVAIRASTGDILAVGQNAAADSDGPVAMMGQYPPGSTFKIVTAGAAIDRQMATPNTMLACPGTMDIGHRTVPNYGGFDLGVVPMSRAFASSCNTTFAELASRMPRDGLTVAAAQYGIGPDYDIPGIFTVSGSVPPTVDLAERTEDGFGQGKVLVSPFGMAMAAATVAAGRTPLPQLILGRHTAVTGAQPPISQPMLDGLRSMMRLVVTNGTASDLAGAGDVRGKTGEAEFVGGSHSWFVGYRGDLAFASLIVGGGSSEYAVDMTRVMFDSLPPDYLT